MSIQNVDGAADRSGILMNPLLNVVVTGRSGALRRMAFRMRSPWRTARCCFETVVKYAHTVLASVPSVSWRRYFQEASLRRNLCSLEVTGPSSTQVS